VSLKKYSPGQEPPPAFAMALPKICSGIDRRRSHK